MKHIFEKLSQEFSAQTTKYYSTSFSFGIKVLDQKLHQPIYNIYGFVRFADEIVDTFHDYDKKKLLNKFRQDCYNAIEDKISLNPILNSFQKTVNKYQIDHKLIHCFLESMSMDLEKETSYDQGKYEKYILGSAEVVGLMCLKIFCYNNDTLYKKLTPFAQKLGSAFQKVNFLRDMNSDYINLGRMYFPNIKIDTFNIKAKKEIEADIASDFKIAYKGVKMLPKEARGGVYLAYIYYFKLFLKIKNMSPETILTKRIRVHDFRKILLMTQAVIKNKLNLI